MHTFSRTVICEYRNLAPNLSLGSQNYTSVRHRHRQPVHQISASNNCIHRIQAGTADIRNRSYNASPSLTVWQANWH